jgi:predicted RND superfamily exporter protein
MYIEQFPLSKRLTSILDVVKDLNRTVNENREEFYRVPDSEEQVAQLLLLYENAGGSEANYWIDYDYRYLRMMVEISTYNSNELDKEIAAITQKGRELFPNATVSAVGNIPQFTTMQQYLVKGQIRSFGISILIVAVLLMIVFGSVRTGLIGMIPNVAPAIFVGGYLGWLGIPLDMMSATVIPMVIGLAVDDTIHFVNHTNEEFNKCNHYSSAILRVFRSTGSALVMTTVIMCGTFVNFTTSKCIMLCNFGLVLVVGLGSALLADLFVTPVLIKKFRIFGKETGNGKEN